MTGSRLADEDAELLQVLLAEVRRIRERAQVERLSSEGGRAGARDDVRDGRASE